MMKDTIPLVMEEQFARIPRTTGSSFALWFCDSVILWLFQNLWQAQQKCKLEALSKEHSPSLSLHCLTVSCALLPACSCQLPDFMWPCTAVTEYLAPSFGCVTARHSLSLTGHLQ